MLQFKPKYLVIGLFIFLIELLIALYIHDQVIRPFIGDLLVVILIYYFTKAFIKLPSKHLLLSVWIFAIMVEISQHFKLINTLNLEHERWAQLVFGNSFSWIDILMYSIGILLIPIIEKSGRHLLVMQKKAVK